ncbi:helix-turn-helix domain-containing protein [Corynebacterium flavescens]|uniref:helix-turn-helix domain-containing protein n=1 Tax=Corynebacterium flavescens TaxID=28028 RepID=UPI003FD55E15
MANAKTDSADLQRYETLSQAAKRVQLGERTLRKHIAEGRLVAYRAGRSIRLKPQDVDALFTPTNSWSGGAA